MNCFLRWLHDKFYYRYCRTVVKLDRSRLFYRKMPDAMFLKCQYYLMMGERLDVEHPRGFNQKIQWLKLYHRDPLYTRLADKVAVRDVVRERIGEEYLVPLLGAWEHFDDIDLDALPQQFALKCNHDCGSVVLCKDKASFDVAQACAKIEGCLKKNCYYEHPYREWQYRDIPPKVIAEPYLTDPSGREIDDYKIYCFNGVPRFVSVHSGRFSGKCLVTFFDMAWNAFPFDVGYERHPPSFPPPERFEEMVSLSAALAKDIPHVRVDWYCLGGKPYFGEMTFTSHGGYHVFNPPEWNATFGDWLTLPPKIPLS